MSPVGGVRVDFATMTAGYAVLKKVEAIEPCVRTTLVNAMSSGAHGLAARCRQNDLSTTVPNAFVVVRVSVPVLVCGWVGVRVRAS